MWWRGLLFLSGPCCLTCLGALELEEGTETLGRQLASDELPESVNLIQSRYAIVNSSSSSARSPRTLAGVQMLASDAGARAAADAAARADAAAGATAGLVVVLGLIACGIAAGFGVYVGKAPTLPDVCVWAACFGVVLVTGIGMWGDVNGGKMPMTDWFGWHPVLMVTAFMGLMVLGRWAYATESPLGTKADRRRAHRALMVLAALVMIMGYVAIFVAHWPDKKFLGYYFHAREWAAWQRIVHVYLGYATILLTISQASMGLVKYERLKDGEKVFTFHGQLGKLIIGMAGATVVMGIWAWSWDSGVAVLLGVFTGACVIFGTLWPTPVLE